MDYRDDLFADNVGAVTILTDNHIIYQGQVKKDSEGDYYKQQEFAPPKEKEHHKEFEHHHKEKEKEKFPEHPYEKKCCDPRVVVLKLTCDPAIIEPDGRIRKISPQLFEEGDIIRINVFEIVAVGPSRCCFGESEDDYEDDDD